TWWSRTPVTVGTADVLGLKVPARKGASVRGRFEFAGQATPAAAEIAQVVVQLVPETAVPAGAGAPNAPPAPNAQPWRGQVLPEGTFTTMGVPAGRYFLRIAAVPRGWTLESTTVGSRDFLDTSLEIQS